MENYGLTDSSDKEEWGKFGPLAEPTPADAKTEERRTEEEGGEMREATLEGEEKEAPNARDMTGAMIMEEGRRGKTQRQRKREEH